MFVTEHANYQNFILENMPKIIIKNINNQEVDIYDTNKSVLQHFAEAYIDWMQACGGKGRCTTCKMILHEGLQNLSPPSTAEQKFQKMDRLQPGERLACQCSLQGDILISTPQKYKLPHINYSDN